MRFAAAGGTRSYFSADSVDDLASDHDASMYPPEYLHTLSPSGMPPHELKLAVGCPVMCLRNLKPAVI